jgi:excisionase family DNA binding protein
MEKYYSASNCSANLPATVTQIYPARAELPNYKTVEEASFYFKVSTRRVRKLLSDGRLAGAKNGKLWHVTYPYQYIIGTRGPQLLRQQADGKNFRPYKAKRKKRQRNIKAVPHKV